MTKENVDKEINKVFNISADKIKDNMLNKSLFIRKYNLIYRKTFNMIMEGLQHDSKQK